MSQEDRSLESVGGIVVVEGPDSGLVVPLDERPMVLGRETGCDVRLVDPAASRRHLLLAPDNRGRWFLEDLGSSNGTYLGDRRIEREPVVPGAEISLGETRLRVLSVDEIQGSLRRRTTRAAKRDPVAQICTRELFEMRLRTEVGLAAPKGGIISLAVVELDRARELEARAPGTLVRVLPAIALLLGGVIRENELLARFGDDSFAALLLDQNPTLAYVTAERLCTGTQFVRVDVGGESVPITASVGLATDKGRRDLTADELIERALGQARLAREAGGNCVSRWVHVSARICLPSVSSDVLPTEMEGPRKTRILRTASLGPARTTLPPPVLRIPGTNESGDEGERTDPDPSSRKRRDRG
ncbi:MAG: FHA domain-containing protein [Deltaproteobacteria bacterium]|nr:FHA domain-containing protein [Deltaproteobacteria bacterium]